MPSNEFVTINIGGMQNGGWKSFSCTASARSPERTFQVVAARANPLIPMASPTIKPGDECTVTANGSLLVTGFIEEVSIEISPDQHEVRITGKSKGAKTVKNSVDHDKHEWRDKTLLDVAKELDKAGVGFSTDEALKKIPVCRANVGQKCFAFLDQLAAREGMFLTAQPDGSIKITRHGKESHSGGIIEGLNLIRGVATFSNKERFAKYKTKGHQPTGSGEKNYRYEEETSDEGAPKGTVKIITPRTSLDRREAKEAAELAANTRYGDSVKFQAELQGFRDEGGQLWVPGRLVYCEVPSCDLSMALAIDEVTWSQNEKQSMSNLSLVHPSALGGDKGGKTRSGKPGSKPTTFQSGGWGGRTK